MRSILTLCSFLMLTPGFFFTQSVLARENAPAVTADGMHLVPDTELGLVYADPDADLSIYKRLLLMDAQVSFRKDWQREINQDRPFNVTAQDMENIKTSLAELFREVFTAELEATGHELTTEQAPDVLIVRPAIIDLDVASPESQRATQTRNIQRTAGNMTLYLELRDSVTGDILVKAMDFQFDRSNPTPHMRDSSRNEAAARRILRNWAEVLAKGLDEAQQATSGR